MKNPIDIFCNFLLKRILKFSISYNIHDNILFINLPENLKVIFNHDIDVNCKGEINLTSYGHPINLDSLQSKIYLNSFKSKSIRNVKKYADLRDETHKKRIESKKAMELAYENKIQELVAVIGELTTRVSELESKSDVSYAPSKKSIFD